MMKKQKAERKGQSVKCRLAVMPLLFALCSMLHACTMNPNVQGRGDERLQGVWEEDSLDYRSTLLSYTKHGFTFTCDSVYARLVTFSKTNIYPDSCYNAGTWKEYAKGRYGLRNDTLYLEATYTHANYKQKLSGCYNIGQYLPVFVIRKQVADTLYLDNLQSHIPLKLVRKQKLVCQPKEL